MSEYHYFSEQNIIDAILQTTEGKRFFYNNSIDDKNIFFTKRSFFLLQPQGQQSLMNKNDVNLTIEAQRGDLSGGTTYIEQENNKIKKVVNNYVNIDIRIWITTFIPDGKISKEYDIDNQDLKKKDIFNFSDAFLTSFLRKYGKLNTTRQDGYNDGVPFFEKYFFVRALVKDVLIEDTGLKKASATISAMSN